MKNTTEKSSKKKLNFWFKFTMFFVIIFFFVAIIKMNIQINDMKAELKVAESEFQQRQLSIEKIKAEIDSLPNSVEELDEETIKKIANEKLDLRDSDVIIFATSQPN